MNKEKVKLETVNTLNKRHHNACCAGIQERVWTIKDLDSKDIEKYWCYYEYFGDDYNYGRNVLCDGCKNILKEYFE
jgi:hypothetical protein